jgi:hypothetical protein
MSIQDVATSFVNVSVGPYVIDECWFNNKGFTQTGAQSLILPGLYPQGSSIVSLHVLSTQTALSANLNQASLQIWATGSATDGVLLLDTITYQNVSGNPQTGLGQTLPQDSWLYATFSGAGTSLPGMTGKSLGVAVKWTKLTQTQGSLYQ